MLDKLTTGRCCIKMFGGVVWCGRLADWWLGCFKCFLGCVNIQKIFAMVLQILLGGCKD